MGEEHWEPHIIMWLSINFWRKEIVIIKKFRIRTDNFYSNYISFEHECYFMLY